MPLNIHSRYSILQSLISVDEIVSVASSFGIKSLAITDCGNMHGVVEFYKKCLDCQIRPIIGCEVYLANNRFDKKKISYPLILLVKNKEGYHNICKLTSYSYTEGFYYRPRIDKELLTCYHKGLIVISGPFYGKLGELICNDDEEGLQEELHFFNGLFGEDFYMQVSNHHVDKHSYKESWLEKRMIDNQNKERKITKKILELSNAGISYVGVHDVRYLSKDDWHAHEVLSNVSFGDAYKNKNFKPLENPKRMTPHSRELYFKSPEEIKKLWNEFPDAISNGIEIAGKIEFDFDFKEKYYPSFSVPESFVGTKEDYLSHLCYHSFDKRYNSKVLDNLNKVRGLSLSDIKKRIEYELEIILSKDMCDYLLIVNDFVSWAKSKGIPVGPGRGSGAGSIICYLIGITDVEPLQFNLLFERFINPERLSYPDIDVDICMERRGEVIDYTMKKYGQGKVAQIITFGTMKAKMVVRDVGRVLGIPLSQVNKIIKLIPEEPGITLQLALEKNENLRRIYSEDDNVKELLDLAKKLEGSIRNASVHAAGLIISKDCLMDHIPICVSKDAQTIVTQYSMEYAAMVGLLKIDLLGLKTLSCLKRTTQLIELNTGDALDWSTLELDDKKTYELLSSGNTSGIFQLESHGMKDLVKKLKIDRFEEIIAVGALYRPGPMQMIPSFIRRKHKMEDISYDHDYLKDILSETYGIMVYQEQVMQIAQKLADYTLAEGDVLRRAMGKKKHDIMNAQRVKFKSGAMQKGLDEGVANKIFEKIEKFASYGFNKSHAACYGYLTYATSFFKANYPLEWMCALMTYDSGDISKTSKHIRDCRSMGVKILSPDVNQSSTSFTPTKEGIRFALTAIKGIGRGVVTRINKEVKNNGSFVSFIDFLKRIDLSKIGCSSIELLVASGAFDFTGYSRLSLSRFLSDNFNLYIKLQKDSKEGSLDLFQEDPSISESEENRLESLKREKELLGFYLTGNPLCFFSETLNKLKTSSLSELETLSENSLVKIPFIVDSIVFKSSKTGQQFCSINMGDGLLNKEIESTLWSNLVRDKRDILCEGNALVGIFYLSKSNGYLRLRAKDLFPLEDVNIEEFNKSYESESKQKSVDREVQHSLHILLDVDKVSLGSILLIKKLIYRSHGSSKLNLEFKRGEESYGKVICNRASISLDRPTKERLMNIRGLISLSFD